MNSNQSVRYFGTDGIRGTFGASFFTPEFVLRLGLALGHYCQQQGILCVLVGQDPRNSGDVIASLLVSGLLSYGIDVQCLGILPTPAVAYLTRQRGKISSDTLGVMISASHNLYSDNGIKCFGPDGYKLSDEAEQILETLLLQVDLKDCYKTPHQRYGQRVVDLAAASDYSVFCKAGLPEGFDLRDLKIVVDCAHGAIADLAGPLLDSLGAQVLSIHAAPNGFNINDQCGSVFPRHLQAKVLAQNADLGIAFDGDADRLLLVTHDGHIVNGDQILYILVRDDLDQNKNIAGVVGTEMSNIGLEYALRELKVDFYRAPVGDRSVLQALNARGWRLGGESSGHILDLEQSTTGDAMLAALRVLSVMVRNRQSLSQLIEPMRVYPQLLINIALPRTQPLEHLEPAIHQAREALANTGRVFVRRSGTEPVLRLMIEGSDQNQIEQIGALLAESIEVQLVR
jgi:phosphoglucosamine mutase